MWVQSLGREDPWSREWQPTPVFMPGKSHRQRSLVGYCAGGGKRVWHKWATEHTHTHTQIYIWQWFRASGFLMLVEFPLWEVQGLLQWKLLSHVLLFATPWNRHTVHGILQPDTGVGSLPLLQEIFPTEGWIPGLPHCRQFIYQLSLKGIPRLLEWVAYPFSSTSSQSRNWTRVSWIAGGFFTNWVIREIPQGQLDEPILFPGQESGWK